jgi:hypothetical protein
MKFVHHNTGEWVRSNGGSAATRTDGSVVEYSTLDEIKNDWVKEQFQWMLEIGEIVITCGSDVFQIRRST